MTLRSESWPTLGTLEARKALLAIVPRLEVHPDRVEITIDNAGLAAWLEEEVDGPVPDRPDPTASDRAVTVLTVPVRLKQRGNEPSGQAVVQRQARLRPAGRRPREPRLPSHWGP